MILIILVTKKEKGGSISAVKYWGHSYITPIERNKNAYEICIKRKQFYM